MRTWFLWACCLFIGFESLIPPVFANIKKDRFYFERQGYAHWQVPTQEKLVALTFDDGPDPKYTPEVLQVLAEYGDHGTFFLIGKKVAHYPKIVRETVVLGNELGNHTFTHRRLKHMNTAEFEKEITRTNDAIEEVTGHATQSFRPPRGYYDEPTILTAHRLGFPVIMWSWDEDTRDWQDPGVDKIVSSVLNHLHPGDIILFHDGTGHSQQTVTALRIILPKLHELGYRSVTISQLLHSVPPQKVNATHKSDDNRTNDDKQRE